MKVKLHPAFKTASGMMDGLVYRQVGDQLIISKRPRPAAPGPTPAQQAQRQRFSESIAYAQRILDDPWQREIYADLARERQRRADKLLAADYLTPPEVRRIDLTTYRGQPGDVIHIIAVDDIEVVSVHVAIQSAAGAILEEGAARKVHGVWLYPATTTAPAGERLTVTAVAEDRPGNKTTATAVYS